MYVCVIIWSKLWFSVVSDCDKHDMLKETEPTNSQSPGKKMGLIRKSTI